MTVNYEDREAAADVISDLTWAGKQVSAGHAGALVERLLAHGWGPRPALSRADLFDNADDVTFEAEEGICARLMAAGIEVTE